MKSPTSRKRREKWGTLILGNREKWATRHFEEFFDAVRKAARCCEAEVVAEIRETLLGVSEKLGVPRQRLEQLFR